MLKVVGASWEQTRATSYTLILFTFCGLLIIIFGGSVTFNDMDGNYAATVFWQSAPGFKIEFWGQGNVLADVPLGAARGYYRQDIANTGWSKIEIETNPDYPDWIQAYSAGLLEGSLTWQLIHWRWKNTIAASCESNLKNCEHIRSELEAWGDAMRTALTVTETEVTKLDPFWHQIRLFFAQVDGLINGWNYAIRRKRLKHTEISNTDFLWMNLLATDVPLPDRKNLMPSTPSLSSTLLKMRQTNKSEEVLVAQTTASSYRDMLRIMKRYIFSYRLTNTEESAPVPGTVLEFTGYPGAVSSQDDLYIISSKFSTKHSLLVTGSTIGHEVPTFQSLSEQKVPGTVRALVSSRLARDGRTWTAYFNRGLGGTNIAKQWSVLDISKLNTEDSNLLWIIEQPKGHSTQIHASDVSETFRKDRYFTCYGVPYHKEVEINMNLTEKYTKLYSFVSSTRGEALSKCGRNCTTKEEVFHAVRNAVPVSEDLIGARADLYNNNPTPFGVIDTKIITGFRGSSLHLEVTAGPVYTANTTAAENPAEGAAPPFQWSTSSWFAVLHEGQPDIWSFSPWKVTWAGY